MTMNEMMVEQRLEALERTVAALQLQLARVAAAGSWLDKVSGSITDEAAFLEALRHGQALRQADRPQEQSGS